MTAKIDLSLLSIPVTSFMSASSFKFQELSTPWSFQRAGYRRRIETLRGVLPGHWGPPAPGIFSQAFVTWYWWLTINTRAWNEGIHPPLPARGPGSKSWVSALPVSGSVWPVLSVWDLWIHLHLNHQEATATHGRTDHGSQQIMQTNTTTVEASQGDGNTCTHDSVQPTHVHQLSLVVIYQKMAHCPYFNGKKKPNKQKKTSATFASLGNSANEMLYEARSYNRANGTPKVPPMPTESQTWTLTLFKEPLSPGLRLLHAAFCHYVLSPPLHHWT